MANVGTFKNLFCKFTKTDKSPIMVNISQVACATAGLGSHLYFNDGTDFVVIESFEDVFTAQHGSPEFFSTFGTFTTSSVEDEADCYNAPSALAVVGTSFYVPYPSICFATNNQASVGITAGSLIYGPLYNYAVIEHLNHFQAVDGFAQLTISADDTYGPTSCTFDMAVADPLFVNLQYILDCDFTSSLNIWMTYETVTFAVLEHLDDVVGFS